jgi:4'-phosphopantetheinyl transferase
MDGLALGTHSGRLTPHDKRDALAMLSAAERERLEGMPTISGAAFLAGRLVLRRLAGEQLGIAPDRVPLAARCPDCGGPHGQPIIEGSELRVSLSKSALGVVAVAGWGRALGVDVEPAEASQERLDAIQAVTGGPGLERWTRIEAVLKADGRGLRVDPRDVIIEPAPAGWRARVADSAPSYRLWEPRLDPAWQVSVAIALPD